MNNTSKTKEKKPKESDSDFGSGLIYNLVLFAKHFERDELTVIYQLEQREISDEDVRNDKVFNFGYGDFKLSQLNPFYWVRRTSGGSHQEAISNAIEMWANGACDHLSELQQLKEPWWTVFGWKQHAWYKNINTKIMVLQEIGMRMRIWGMHNQKPLTTKDVDWLWELITDIAEILDKKLKVKFIKANYD